MLLTITVSLSVFPRVFVIRSTPPPSVQCTERRLGECCVAVLLVQWPGGTKWRARITTADSVRNARTRLTDEVN